MKNNRYVQLQNPKTKMWVKIDIELGMIISRKKTPYKNITKKGDYYETS